MTVKSGPFYELGVAQVALEMASLDSMCFAIVRPAERNLKQDSSVLEHMCAERRTA